MPVGTYFSLSGECAAFQVAEANVSALIAGLYLKLGMADEALKEGPESNISGKSLQEPAVACRSCGSGTGPTFWLNQTEVGPDAHSVPGRFVF